MQKTSAARGKRKKAAAAKKAHGNGSGGKAAANAECSKAQTAAFQNAERFNSAAVLLKAHNNDHHWTEGITNELPESEPESESNAPGTICPGSRIRPAALGVPLCATC